MTQPSNIYAAHLLRKAEALEAHLPPAIELVKAARHLRELAPQVDGPLAMKFALCVAFGWMPVQSARDLEAEVQDAIAAGGASQR